MRAHRLFIAALALAFTGVAEARVRAAAVPIVTIPFLSIFGVYLFFKSVREYLDDREATAELRASKGWTATTAMVETSKLFAAAISPAGKGQYYYPDVVYRFRVASRDYTGTRLTFEPPIPLPDRLVRFDLDRMCPAGKHITVWYDPADPARNVIERRHGVFSVDNRNLRIMNGAEIGMAVLGLVIAATGIGLGIYAWG